MTCALPTIGTASKAKLANVLPTGRRAWQAASSANSRESHQQLVLDRLLQMPVRALDRAVLMREAGIVARRRHAVMGAKILVAPRKVIACGAIEIAERGRQAVAAVLFGHAAQRPQGVPQALGERQEALAAEHHMGMLEA